MENSGSLIKALTELRRQFHHLNIEPVGEFQLASVDAAIVIAREVTSYASDFLPLSNLEKGEMKICGFTFKFPHMDTSDGVRPRHIFRADARPVNFR